MNGLMMDMPLLLSSLIDHAAENHGDCEVVAREIEGDVHRYTYREARARARRMARALQRLGVRHGEPVGTLAWNTFRHFELFYAVPGIGAVLRTVNPRLFHEQIAYIVNHAEDRLMFVDALTLPLAEVLAPSLKTVRGWVVMCERARMPATTLPGAMCYDDLVDAEDDAGWAWPSFDERSASTICYTSGTTGHPKGVVYSHRAAVLQTMGGASFDFLPGHASGVRETFMPMAPMFHGNAWNLPFIAPYTGSRLVLPGRDYEPHRLYELLEGERVTVTAGVPSFWLILLDWLQRNGKRFSTLRMSLSSGSAPPRGLVETLERDYGVEYVQCFGMTEALMASTPSAKPGTASLPMERRIDLRLKSGRGVPGVRLRVVDDAGRELPRDGTSVGHLRVKGPWIASGYLKGEGDALDDEGWLKTGDMAVIDPEGYVTLTDRAKDVIKSGGEWISSIQLESAALSHPAVLQAAAIAVPHPTWQERPLLVVVPRPGASVTAAELLEHLSGRVAKWWLPDAVEFVEALPMTGTGKVHKLTLRERFAGYVL